MNFSTSIYHVPVTYAVEWMKTQLLSCRNHEITLKMKRYCQKDKTTLLLQDVLLSSKATHRVFCTYVSTDYIWFLWFS